MTDDTTPEPIALYRGEPLSTLSREDLEAAFVEACQEVESYRERWTRASIDKIQALADLGRMTQRSWWQR